MKYIVKCTKTCQVSQRRGNFMINLFNLFTKSKSLNVNNFLNENNCNKILSKSEYNTEVYEYSKCNLNRILETLEKYKIKINQIDELYFFYIFCERLNKNILIIPRIHLDPSLSLDEFYIKYKPIINNIQLDYSNKRNLLIHLYYALNMNKPNCLKSELSDKYSLILFDKNTITIHDRITCDLYRSLSGKVNKLPQELRINTNEIKFVLNSSNLLVEVKVFTDKNLHPNINYTNNKYCIGNFIHMPVTCKLITDLIETIKIYNLKSYYILDSKLNVIYNEI